VKSYLLFLQGPTINYSAFACLAVKAKPEGRSLRKGAGLSEQSKRRTLTTGLGVYFFVSKEEGKFINFCGIL